MRVLIFSVLHIVLLFAVNIDWSQVLLTSGFPFGASYLSFQIVHKGIFEILFVFMLLYLHHQFLVAMVM